MISPCLLLAVHLSECHLLTNLFSGENGFEEKNLARNCMGWVSHVCGGLWC